jgi:hypothetical protein
MNFLLDLSSPLTAALNVGMMGIFAGCALYIARGAHRKRDFLWLVPGVFVSGVYIPVAPLIGTVYVARHRRASTGEVTSNALSRDQGDDEPDATAGPGPSDDEE